MKLTHEEETYKTRGAGFEVYEDKGSGFFKGESQKCLELELGFRGGSFVSQPDRALSYKGVSLKQRYKPDSICYDKVLVELKGMSKLTDEHRAQVIIYPQATGLKVGLFVNFGHYTQVENECIVV